MLDLKSIFESLVLISFILKIYADYDYLEPAPWCKRVVYEGKGPEVKQILQNFKDMKTIVQESKSSCGEKNEFCSSAEKRTDDLYMFDIRFDKFPTKCLRSVLPKNCAEATACTQRSGIYIIQVPPNNTQPFYVECDDETKNGSWIVIQRRQDGSVDFFRTWNEYEKGFGDIDGEFFIGLQKLYALTSTMGTQELMIIVEKDQDKRAYAYYDSFAIANATDLYRLKKLGRYTGNAGDSLMQSVGFKFSTKDRKNHEAKENCAERFTGAWWYNDCHYSNLNGRYGDNRTGKGINWFSYTGYENSLKYVKMMIRRRRFK